MTCVVPCLYLGGLMVKTKKKLRRLARRYLKTSSKLIHKIPEDILLKVKMYRIQMAFISYSDLKDAPRYERKRIARAKVTKERIADVKARQSRRRNKKALQEV